MIVDIVDIGENAFWLVILTLIVVSCSDIGRPDNIALGCPVESEQKRIN